MNKFIPVLSLCLILQTACQHNQHKVTINDISFQVELADDDNERALGLMYREQMGDNQGMLFIFPDSQPRAFWMQNTLIPLDILYFDHNRKLINVSGNTPPCKNTTTRCPNYPSKKPAKYVLEINAGLSQKHGFKPGDEITFQLKK
ncbi:MAG: DUF192 domain-containing protein [Marinicella sp.]|nr:DUF192 domain-containing protein [Xanthomonadales bacterium]